MRIISNVELDAVSGGEWWNSWDDLKEVFGFGSSAPSCTPSSVTNGSTTIAQTCGSGGVSTTIVTSPGVVNIVTTTPGTSGSVGGNYGPAGVNGSITGSGSITTTNCIGGKCTTNTVSK